MTFADSVGWILSSQIFGVKLGLENMQRIAGALGHPESSLRFVHVAGTNGKGSTCAFAESIARSHGLRCGFYTSPHLISIRERFQVGRVVISESEFAEYTTRVRHTVESWHPHPTYFELTTAIALLHFAACKVDLVIWETGMGGRLDATNIVTPLVSVITPVAMDHAKWLGETLSAIAREKAGIIEAGVPVVTCPQDDTVREVIESIAAERHAPLTVTSPLPSDTKLGLAGKHQLVNAALAVTALRTAGFRLATEDISEGLAHVSWPGRLQDLGGFLLDGAHNPHAIEVLRAEWQGRYGEARTTIVLGALADKDVAGLIAGLRTIASRFILAPVNSDRGAATADLAQAVREVLPGVAVEESADVKEAMARAKAAKSSNLGIPVLVTGSLFLVGEALEALGWPADKGLSP